MIGSVNVTAQFDMKGRVSTSAPSHTYWALIQPDQKYVCRVLDGAVRPGRK